MKTLVSRIAALALTLGASIAGFGSAHATTVATVSGEVFYYISQRAEQKLAFMQQTVTNQRVIAVYFDKQRRVQRIANYGLKDGRVFDFVARTTPSGGTELNYLNYIFSITKPLGS